MQPQSDDDEDEQQDAAPPAYPASGYTSASSFQPGFGFGAPSKSWLKARGIIKPQFKGGSGTATGESLPEPMDVEEDHKSVPQDKRAKLLKRFDRPESELPDRELLPLPPAPQRETHVRHTDARVREMWESRMDAGPELVHVPVLPPRPTFPGLTAAFETRAATDMTLILDDSTPIHAHKTVLSARSPFFLQMFASNFSETASNEVKLCGFSERAVTAFVEYCYTGKLRTTGEFVLELLLLAHYCRVGGLKAVIEEYLGSVVDEENVAALSAAAVDCKAWQLREYCVKYILKNQQKLTKVVKEVPKDIALEVKTRAQILSTSV